MRYDDQFVRINLDYFLFSTVVLPVQFTNHTSSDKLMLQII